MFLKPDANSLGYLGRQHGKEKDNTLPLKMTVSSFSGISYAASTPGGSCGQNEDINSKSAVLTAGCLRQMCLV